LEGKLPARYHFDLENGPAIIRDERGVVADNLNQAVEQAILGSNELRASGELEASLAEWTLVIRDEDGTELKRLRL
jgi:hypothetical protein